MHNCSSIHTGRARRHRHHGSHARSRVQYQLVAGVPRAKDTVAAAHPGLELACEGGEAGEVALVSPLVKVQPSIACEWYTRSFYSKKIFEQIFVVGKGRDGKMKR